MEDTASVIKSVRILTTNAVLTIPVMVRSFNESFPFLFGSWMYPSDLVDSYLRLFILENCIFMYSHCMGEKELLC